MKIVIGCDPNAEPMKLELIDELKSLGHKVEDFGSDDPIYANVVFRVGEAVAAGEYKRGIVLCGTGIGASIAANKVPGVYCALLTDTYQAQRAALSNNANLIALGAQVTGPKLARLIVHEWMLNFYEPNERSEPKIKRIRDYTRTKKNVP